MKGWITRASSWFAVGLVLTCGLCSADAGGGTDPADGTAGSPGLTFGPERPLGRAAANPSSPFLRIGPGGRLYAVWTEDDPNPAPGPKRPVDPAHRKHSMITFDMRAVLLASSGDGGGTWSMVRRVNSDTEAAQGEENEPKVAFTDEGRALVVWSIPDANGDKGRANVRFAMEDEKGVFTPARTLNDVKDTARFPLLERSPDGTFFLAWIDRRVDTPTPRALYAARMTANGQSVSTSFKVAENICECCRLGVAFADEGRTVYMVNRQVTKEQVRNHVLRKSTDGGATFGPPVTISDDRWVTGCPHSGPSLALDRRGHLHVTWFTLGRAPEEAGVYYSVSKDGGRTFSPRRLVHANTAPEVLHTTLAVGEDSTVYLAWDNLDDGGRAQVFARTLAPDGTTWTSIQQISRATENARRPTIALSEGVLYLAWTESVGETSSIVLRRASVTR